MSRWSGVRKIISSTDYGYLNINNKSVILRERGSGGRNLVSYSRVFLLKLEFSQIYRV